MASASQGRLEYMDAQGVGHKRTVSEITVSDDDDSPSTKNLRSFTIVNNEDGDKFIDQARTMWLDHRTEVEFSSAQTDVVVKFAASVMAFANKNIGTTLRDCMKEFGDSIKAEMHQIAQNVSSNVHTATSSDRKKLNYAEVCNQGIKARGEDTRIEDGMPVSVKRVSEKSCFAVLHAADPEDKDDNRANKWTDVLRKRQKREKFKVLSTETTKARNLTVRFPNPQERDRFTESLQKEPIHGAVLRSSADNKVALAIRRVPGYFNAKELTREIIEQNPDHRFLVNGRLQIEDSRQPQDGVVDDRKEKTFKIITTVHDAKILLDDPYFYVGLQRVRVSLWKPNRRCSNCHDSDHKTNQCKSRIICKYCSGNHVSYKCLLLKSKENHKCVVCERLQKPSNHCADPVNCEVLAKEVQSDLDHIYALINANHG